MTDDRFKWKVMSAVRLSKGLTRDQRVVLMMLADCAEDNGRTLPRWAPSLGQLATWTGLGRSTVAEVLNQLDVEAKKPDEAPGLGWVRRFQPTVEAARSLRHKTLYQVLIGTDPEPAPKQKRPRRTAEAAPSSSPQAGLVQDLDYSPGPGAGLVQEPDYREDDIADFEEWSGSRTSPGAGLELVQEPDPPSPGAGLALVREPDTTPATPAVAPATPAKNTPRADARLRDEAERADRQQARAAAADTAEETFELAEPPAEKKPTKRTAKPKTDETPDFVAFYEAYPRKAKRPDALASWLKALGPVNAKTGAPRTPPTPEQMIAGAKAYATQCANDGTAKKWIAHPTTWLNNECWNDDYDTAPPQGQGGHTPYHDPTDLSIYEEEM